MPYARFIQLSRIAGEKEIEEKQDEWRRHAFSGWLAYVVQPKPRRHRLISWQQWQRIFGMQPKRKYLKLNEQARQEELQKANENVGKVVDMFKSKAYISRTEGR